MKKHFAVLCLFTLALLVDPGFAWAASEGGDAAFYMPIGIGLTLGLAALGGTLAQGKSLSSGLDAIGRNPSARGDIFTPMLVGLAFIESLVIISFGLSFLMLQG